MLRVILITVIIISISVLVVRSCYFKKQSFDPGKATVSFHTHQPVQDTSPAWTDGLLKTYLDESRNEFIQLARQDSIPLEWMLDRIENTDTASYYIFHIGHTVADDGRNSRFVTDAWMYVDTLTRKLYEYDVANDSLVEWKR